MAEESDAREDEEVKGGAEEVVLEPVEVPESADEAQPVEAAKQVEVAQPVEAAKQVEVAQPVEAAKQVEVAQPVEMPQALEEKEKVAPTGGRAGAKGGRGSDKAAPKADEAAAGEKPAQPQTAEEVFMALEGAEDKPKILKAKGSKNVRAGIVHILATYNNTKVSVTDYQGNVIGWSSSGKLGFRGSRKSTAYASQLVSQDACRQAMGHGLKTVEVRVKGPGSGRESAVRAIQNLGIEVTTIKDVTPVPHNGCRPKKPRRV